MIDYRPPAMGLFSWLFPTDADRLASARALMAEGRHAKARTYLMRCSLPEAETLYDECCAVVDKAERAVQKKRLVAEGFRGWKIDVSTSNPRVKKELEGLVAKEIAKAGVDLSEPDVDQAALKIAVDRAQRRATRTNGNEVGTIRLVPIVAGTPKAR